MSRAEYCVIEYCGPPRVGKSTLMVADLLLKLLSDDYAFAYERNEVYANFWVDIKGINCCDNEKMLWTMTKSRKEQWLHKVWMVDEASQPPLFYARNSRDVLQTELVTSLWQMPKKGMTCMYTSNLGNSVDVQMRDATFMTVMPDIHYPKELPREEQYINFTIIHDYELWVQEETFLKPAWVQNYFDSFKPVV